MSSAKKDTFCRTCLYDFANHSGENLKSYNIFEILNFAEIFMQCSCLDITPTDEYPHSLCSKCYQQVLDIYEFQKKCRDSLENFKTIFRCKIDKDLDNTVVDPLNEDINSSTLVNKEHIIENPLEELDMPTATGRRICYKVNKKRIKRYRTETSVTKTNSKEATSIDHNKRERKARNCKHEDNGELLKDQLANSITKKEDNTLGDQSDEDMVLSADCLDSKQTTKYPFRCDECPKTFMLQHRFDAHQRRHKGLPPYLCTHETCERSFNRWHYFQEHLRQHKDSTQVYQCDLDNCERVYKNKSALNIHKRKFHSCGPELKSHVCEMCGKVFKSSAVLNDHRFTHLDKSQLPYVCEVEGCGKKFAKKDKLKVHQLRHEGVKNFICPYCDMRKTTRNELKIHINYHTLERTWPCRFCSKVCNSAGNLKTHVRNIHERAKDFACRFCQRTFAKPDTRKYHEMTHTGEKPHSCEECGRRFIQPAALRTHRKIHLKEKTKNKPEEENAKEGKRKKSAEEKLEIKEKLEIIECTTVAGDN